MQDGDLSIKKVLTAKNYADVETKPDFACFSTTTALLVCRIGVLLTMDPTLHHKMIGHLLNGVSAGCVKQKAETDKMSELVVNIGTGGKLSETLGRVEQLSTWHDAWTMAGSKKKREAGNVQRVTACTLAIT